MPYPVWVEYFNRAGMHQARETLQALHVRAYPLRFEESGARDFESSLREMAWPEQQQGPRVMTAEERRQALMMRGIPVVERKVN